MRSEFIVSHPLAPFLGPPGRTDGNAELIPPALEVGDETENRDGTGTATDRVPDRDDACNRDRDHDRNGPIRPTTADAGGATLDGGDELALASTGDPRTAAPAPVPAPVSGKS